MPGNFLLGNFAEPIYIRFYCLFNKIFCRALFHISFIIKKIADMGNIDFGLQHRWHIQKNKALSQVVVGSKCGKISWRIAEY